MNFADKETLLWGDLSNFVDTACKGRDETHGHKHMEIVAKHSRNIFSKIYGEVNEKNLDKYLKTIAVAWLHDVADHKYDPQGKLVPMINEFLQQRFDPKDTELILNIIDRISYSKENKVRVAGKTLDWEHVLGPEGCQIRDVVSDADKLEAIGKDGVIRCMDYQIHSFKEKNGKDIEINELTRAVLEHADEKLLRLKDEFIRTEPGKELALPLHLEMVKELKKLKEGTFPITI